jgi:pimeloyl-ACP methyl ester carboxylesterase
MFDWLSDFGNWLASFTDSIIFWTGLTSIVALVGVRWILRRNGLRTDLGREGRINDVRLLEMGEGAKWVYKVEEPFKSHLARGGLSTWEQYAEFVTPLGQIQIAMLRHKEDARIIILCRGTANKKNVWTDLKARKQFNSALGCKIHRGFDEAAKEVWVKVLQHLPPQEEGYVYDLAGHSLGGAIAVETAMYLHNSGEKLGDVVTFGAPRITNPAGARIWDKKISVTRVVNDSDLIPLTPMSLPVIGSYCHFGSVIHIYDGGAGYEVTTSQKARWSGNESWWFQILTLRRLPGQYSDHFCDEYIKDILHVHHGALADSDHPSQYTKRRDVDCKSASES